MDGEFRKAVNLSPSLLLTSLIWQLIKNFRCFPENYRTYFRYTPEKDDEMFIDFFQNESRTSHKSRTSQRHFEMAHGHCNRIGHRAFLQIRQCCFVKSDFRLWGKKQSRHLTRPISTQWTALYGQSCRSRPALPGMQLWTRQSALCKRPVMDSLSRNFRSS